jgi:hypothetical protein
VVTPPSISLRRACLHSPPPLPLLDFDPAKIPRRKLKDKNQQQIIRLMAPFSMRCNSCGEYIYKGKKFNARKETALGEDYMGIKARSPLSRPMWTRDAQWLAELTVLPLRRSPTCDPFQIFRFYIKCTLCSTEITFKTDPKNADYICEQGASRNFEVGPLPRPVPRRPKSSRLLGLVLTLSCGFIGVRRRRQSWRDDVDAHASASYVPGAGEDDEDEEEKKRREDEMDAMKMLEASTESSKREMEILDALQDIRCVPPSFASLQDPMALSRSAILADHFALLLQNPECSAGARRRERNDDAGPPLGLADGR